MKLFRKNLLHRKILSIIALFLYSFGFFYNDLVVSSQENYFEEIELYNNTQDELESNKSLPTNPFEIVDMLRKVNSMNDATSPSDAVDEAIKTFDNLKLNNNVQDGFERNSSIPTNPFEIVDMLRKANSMNDATNPSDAIDEAIKTFDNLKLNNK